MILILFKFIEPLSRGKIFVKIRRMTRKFLEISDDIYQKICIQIYASKPLIPADVLTKICKFRVMIISIEIYLKGATLILQMPLSTIAFSASVLRMNDILSQYTPLFLEINVIEKLFHKINLRCG